MNFKFLVAGLLSLLFLGSCSQSLIYAPAFHLSQKQLADKQVEIKAGAGLIPETRPQNNLDDKTLAVNAEIGYGFSNNFNLNLNGWSDFENDNRTRGGLSLSSRIKINKNENIDVIFMPRFAFLFSERSNDAIGFELPFTVLKPFSEKFYGYSGLGLAYGTHSIEKVRHAPTNQMRMPEGIGFIGHLGAGFNFTEKFRLTAEINPIYQVNNFDKENNFVVSPSIAAGFIF